MIDKSKLAALDADGMHNTRRYEYEYGEFDTVKTEPECNWFEVSVRGEIWKCRTCNASHYGANRPKCVKNKAAAMLSPTPSLIQENGPPSDGDMVKTEPECGMQMMVLGGLRWYCEECCMSYTGANKPKCVKNKTAPELPPAPQALIQERSQTHGDFTVNSQVSQAIKRAIRSHGEFDLMEDYQREALDAIAGKIGRIVAGDGSYDDHWRDIAGYAELVLERVRK